MDVVHMTGAINMTGNGVLVQISYPELLRENGVGNVAVIKFFPAVSNATAYVSAFGQVVVKIAADELYRGNVHGFATEWFTKRFDPNASNQFDVMSTKQTENAVQEADRVISLPCSSACHISAKFRSFDLGKDAVQMVVGRIGQLGEELELQIQELAGKVSKFLSIDEQAAYDEDRLVVFSRWIAKFP